MTREPKKSTWWHGVFLNKIQKEKELQKSRRSKVYSRPLEKCTNLWTIFFRGLKEQGDCRTQMRIAYGKWAYVYINTIHTLSKIFREHKSYSLSAAPIPEEQSLGFSSIFLEVFYTHASMVFSNVSPMEAILPPVEDRFQVTK